MMMPSIFGESLFDEMMDDFAFPVFRTVSDVEKNLYGKDTRSIMKTDVKEKDGRYEVDIDLPGFKKEDIQLRLDKGYLTIRAAKSVNNDKKNEDGRYVRKERYSGSMSRSFYVGENVTESDIHAKYENGILSLDLPKEEKRAVGTNKYIAIEG